MSEANPVQVKICCISSAAEAQMAADAGANFLGLVGPMPSGPGVLDHDAARMIAAAAPSEARAVLLTSSDTADGIAADAARVGVGAVQVVRHINRDEAESVAALGLFYVQVIHVEDRSVLGLIDVYAPYCDAFLLDSGRPSQEALGGTGNTHDWSISAEFCRRAAKPTFLAGGLGPDNIAEAIRAVRPYGVDICSGLRVEGALDPKALRAFMAVVAAT